MRRIYFLQLRFNLSEPAVAGALSASPAMRGFVGIDLGREPVPTRRRCAAFAICSKRTTGRRLFAAVPRHLAAKGLKVAAGTIVDALPGARDPEMHRTKKGNQRHFGKGAARPRPPHKAAPCGGRDGGQDRRRHGAARAAARARDPAWGRSGVSRSAGGDRPAC
jgi:IS5 family transposase